MLALLLAGCGSVSNSISVDDDAILADVGGADDWAQPDGWSGAAASCAGAHGSYVRLRMNDIAAADQEIGPGRHSEGATFVADGLQDLEGTAKMRVAMRKVDGYAPDAGDWYWLWLDEAGDTVISGRQPVCTQCHSQGRGYLWHPAIDRPADSTDCVEPPDTGWWYYE